MMQRTGANAAVPTADSPPEFRRRLLRFVPRSPLNFLPAGRLEPQLAQRIDLRAAIKEKCHAAAVLDIVEKSGAVRSRQPTATGSCAGRHSGSGHLRPPMLIC